MEKLFQHPRKVPFRIIFLLIVPAFFLFFALPFPRTHFGNDPEYAYLMNGLNIGMLKPVGHTDHPGTTVQIYGSLILRGEYLLQPEKSEGFEEHVLSHADQYIELERKGLIILNGLMLFVLGLLSFLMLRNAWLSLLLQLMPFVSVTLTEHTFTKVAPEPVLLMAVAVFVLLLLRYYLSQDKGNKKFVFSFSAVTALGLVTKVTFLPLVAIPLIIFNSWKVRKQFLFWLVPFTLLFTIPALPQYPHTAKWFLGLIAHTGIYGEGGLGVINPVRYILDLGGIVVNNPVLIFTMLAASFIIFVSLINNSFRSELRNNLNFRFLFALLIAGTLGVLMVAKHYLANHYIIPELCLMAPTWIFIFFYLKEKVNEKYCSVIRWIPLLLLLISAGMVFSNAAYLKEADKGYRDSNSEYEKMTAVLDKDYSGFTRIYYYPTSVNIYSGLRWGNVYSKMIHTGALQQVFPQGYFFDTRRNCFYFWETPLALQTMASISKGKLLIIGGPFDEGERMKIEQCGIKLTPVFKGRTQIVYSVELPAINKD